MCMYDVLTYIYIGTRGVESEGVESELESDSRKFCQLRLRPQSRTIASRSFEVGVRVGVGLSWVDSASLVCRHVVGWVIFAIYFLYLLPSHFLLS